MKLLHLACAGTTAFLISVIPLGFFSPLMAAEHVSEETALSYESNHTLIVEYSKGYLPEQQAILEELATRGTSVPISDGSSLRCLELVAKEPIYNALRQGTLYRKEYPVGITLGKRRFEVTAPIALDGERVKIHEGFLMDFSVERIAGGILVFFSTEKQQKETIPGASTVRMRSFHSAGHTSIHPNHCMLITGIDGQGGFLLVTYRDTPKF